MRVTPEPTNSSAASKSDCGREKHEVSRIAYSLPASSFQFMWPCVSLNIAEWQARRGVRKVLANSREDPRTQVQRSRFFFAESPNSLYADRSKESRSNDDSNGWSKHFVATGELCSRIRARKISNDCCSVVLHTRSCPLQRSQQSGGAVSATRFHDRFWRSG